MKRLQTSKLDIAYLEGGSSAGQPMLLLHGWPDDPTGLSDVAERLQTHGFRTIVPWLRGFGPTRFRSPETVRDGRAVALARDAIDLLDGLGIERCSVVGHDWGGRAAYNLAALIPDRLDMIAALAIGYAPNGRFTTPGYDQARRWWYQWYMNHDGGAEKVRADPIGSPASNGTAGRRRAGTRKRRSFKLREAFATLIGQRSHSTVIVHAGCLNQST